MHRPSIVALVAMSTLTVACARETVATSTTTLTAAQLRAMPPPAHYWVSPTPRVDRKAPLQEWRRRYPDSALALDSWSARYPSVASWIVDWGAREPEKLEVLVYWSLTYPYEEIGSFFLMRSDWNELSTIARDNPEGVEGFLHWARASRSGAEELAVHQGGLAYVAAHR